MRKDVRKNLDEIERLARIKSISQVSAILFLVLAALCIPVSALNNPKLETSIFYFFVADSVFFRGFIVFTTLGTIGGAIYLVARNKLGKK